MVTIRWMQPFFAFTVSLLMFSLSLAQKVCYLAMNDEIVRAPTFIYALRIYCWIDKQSSFRSIRILIIRWLKCMSEHWRGAPCTRDAHTEMPHHTSRARWRRLSSGWLWSSTRSKRGFSMKEGHTLYCYCCRCCSTCNPNRPIPSANPIHHSLYAYVNLWVSAHSALSHE